MTILFTKMEEHDIIKNYKSGDSFTALIYNERVTGKIYIGNKKGLSSLRVFYMQDRHDGSSPEGGKRYGYRNSYIHDADITEIVIIPAEPIINNTYQIY